MKCFELIEKNKKNYTYTKEKNKDNYLDTTENSFNIKVTMNTSYKEDALLLFLLVKDVCGACYRNISLRLFLLFRNRNLIYDGLEWME